MGVDIGGTFTDFVISTSTGYRVDKIPSSNDDPARAVIAHLSTLFESLDVSPGELRHGTTVATNTILEGQGDPVALFITEGFEDVLVLARQVRKNLYDMTPRQVEIPIEPRCIVGVPERLSSNGDVLKSLHHDEAAALAEGIAARGFEAAAVCLLHAHRNPLHEQILGKELEKRGIRASLSHDIASRPGEFERASTVVVNAAIESVMTNYLRCISHEVNPRGFYVMRSNGAVSKAERLGHRAVETVLSGPAAGVVGASLVARRCGFSDCLTFDMGGTSTDVALILKGELGFLQECSLDELSLSLETVDIHTIGAGGGSLARLDAAGLLKVGPRSAGSDPGPACYGRGGGATVTDANLILGRLRSGVFCHGSMSLDEAASRQAFRPLARSLESTVDALALDVCRVAEASMERALRKVSLERGHDPRDLVLVAFGGAGPLHACFLARSLGCSRVLIPPDPGALCALGVLVADELVTVDRAMCLNAGKGGEGLPNDVITEVLGELSQEAHQQGVKRSWVEEPWVELRYVGQSKGFFVPWSSDEQSVGERFRGIHRRLCGFDHGMQNAELVTVSLRCRRSVQEHPIPLRVSSVKRSPPTYVPVTYRSGEEQTLRFQREHLSEGTVLEGPALVEESTSTTVIPPGSRGIVLTDGSILVQVEGGSP